MTRHCKFIVAISSTALVVSGCSVSPKPLSNLSMSTKVQGKSERGVSVQFNQPVNSVTWTWNGHTNTTKLPVPRAEVTIPVKLAQSTRYSITVNKAEGPNSTPLQEPVTVTGETPSPLTVVTDPGPWQLNVSRTGPFTLQFSAPIVNQNEINDDIGFDPPIPGHLEWSAPTTAHFVPNRPLDWAQTEVMTIKGGFSGPRSTDGQYLSSDSVVRPFVTQSDFKIVVSEKLPQTLYVYKKGKVVLKSLCNTGVAGALTPIGDFYIRSKVPDTDMKGTNPDGTKYDDPHVPWVMGLFGNTAIHGFKRDKYGFPQSNECVELPVNVAHKIYKLVNVGTQVVISQ